MSTLSKGQEGAIFLPPRACPPGVYPPAPRLPPREAWATGRGRRVPMAPTMCLGVALRQAPVQGRDSRLPHGPGEQGEVGTHSDRTWGLGRTTLCASPKSLSQPGFLRTLWGPLSPPRACTLQAASQRLGITVPLPRRETEAWGGREPGRGQGGTLCGVDSRLSGTCSEGDTARGWPGTCVSGEAPGSPCPVSPAAVQTGLAGG